MDGTLEAQNPWTPQPVLDGEWAGWGRYETDPFENLAGPFYSRRDETGRMVCAFRAERKHMNGGGFMHGGCMATFADYSIFMLADKELEGSGSVTASLTTEFLDSAQEGDLVECTGEVTRAGGSMVFVRGLARVGDKPILSFSAIIKKIRRKG
jgi:acyl-coenzyme A thioesterase PaaI-like protein